MRDEVKAKTIKQTINKMESQKMWYVTNRATNDRKLGATPRVQKVVDGVTVDLMEKEAINTKIQEVA